MEPYSIVNLEPLNISQSLRLVIQKKEYFFPLGLLRICFQFLDTYHLSKHCFSICRSFLFTSLYRIRNDTFLDEKMDEWSIKPKICVSYCKNDEIGRKLFFPFCSIWSHMFFKRDEEKTAIFALRVFYSVCMSRQIPNVDPTTPLFIRRIRNMNLWELGKQFRRYFNQKEIVNNNVSSFPPSPWYVDESLISSILSQYEEKNKSKNKNENNEEEEGEHPEKEPGADEIQIFLSVLIYSCFSGNKKLITRTHKRIFENYSFQPATKKFLYDSMIFASCLGNQIKVFKYLKKLEKSYFSAEIENNYPARICCYLGHTEFFSYLIRKCNINLENDENTTLRAACRQGNGEIVKILLNTKGIDPRDGELNRGLRNAMKKNRQNVVTILLDDGRITNEEALNVEFQVSCLRGEIEKVRKMMNDPRINPKENGSFCMRVAAEFGRDEVVKALLEDKRCDPSEGMSHCLRLASQNGHLKTCELLLEDKRAQPQHDNQFCICQSSQNGHFDVVKLLLEDNRVDPTTGMNFPLVIANEHHHYDIVELLLNNHQVDPSSRNDYLLRYSAQSGRLFTLKLLLRDKRVNPGAGGNHALILASKFGHLEILKLLLNKENKDRGVDISAHKYLSIKVSSENDHFEVTKFLVSVAGSDAKFGFDNEILRVSRYQSFVDQKSIKDSKMNFEDLNDRIQFLQGDVFIKKFVGKDSRFRTLEIKMFHRSFFVRQRIFLFLL